MIPLFTRTGHLSNATHIPRTLHTPCLALLMAGLLLGASTNAISAAPQGATVAQAQRLASTMRPAFNPQPDPPARHGGPALSSIMRPAFNPQPDPPARHGGPLALASSTPPSSGSVPPPPMNLCFYSGPSVAIVPVVQGWFGVQGHCFTPHGVVLVTVFDFTTASYLPAASGPLNSLPLSADGTGHLYLEAGWGSCVPDSTQLVGVRVSNQASGLWTNGGGWLLYNTPCL